MLLGLDFVPEEAPFPETSSYSRLRKHTASAGLFVSRLDMDVIIVSQLHITDQD